MESDEVIDPSQKAEEEGLPATRTSSSLKTDVIKSRNRVKTSGLRTGAEEG